jgi:hypothetical protein
MKKRLTLQCWNCPKTYFQTLETSDQKQVIVSCPYCSAEAVIDLNPYCRKTKTVMRGESNDKQNEEELQLPDILPTKKPN